MSQPEYTVTYNPAGTLYGMRRIAELEAENAKLKAKNTKLTKENKYMYIFICRQAMGIPDSNDAASIIETLEEKRNA